MAAPFGLTLGFMNPNRNCQLRRKSEWDARPFLQRPELMTNLPGAMDGLGNLAAPLLPDIDAVRDARERYLHDLRDHPHIGRRYAAMELQAWHTAVDAPRESVAACEMLSKPDTWLVVTGQQPGLLLGPMYTFIKAVQTIALAEQLTEEGLGTVLPAFWIASEDHQLNELNSVAWFGRGKQIERFSFEDAAPERTSAFARSSTLVNIEALTAQFRETVPESDSTAQVLDSICETHQGSLADWFQQLLWRWLPESGMIVLRPDMLWLQRAARERFAEEIRSPLSAVQELEQASERLKEIGVAEQIHKRADRTAFFLVRNGVREQVFVEGNHFKVGEDTFRQDDLIRLLQDDPKCFSSTAILRPVIQDALLPTLATVLGPNELAYHLQLGGIYARHGVPRPAIVPRAGITLLDARAEELLEELQIVPTDLGADPRALAKSIAERTQNPELTARHESVNGAIEAFFGELQLEAQKVDPTIEGPLAKQRKAAQKAINDSFGLLNRRRSERDEVTARRIEQLRAQILPEGKLQERTIGAVSALIRYPGFYPALKNEITGMQPGEHAFLIVEENNE